MGKIIETKSDFKKAIKGDKFIVIHVTGDFDRYLEKVDGQWIESHYAFLSREITVEEMLNRYDGCKIEAHNYPVRISSLH